MSKKNGFLILVLLIVVFLVSCAAHQPPAEPGGASFWMGLWHGICSPIAFIVSFFKDIRIYSFPNGGKWYDFGFLLGISIWGGGGASAACRKKE